MTFGSQYDIKWSDITDERLPDEILTPIDRFKGYDPRKETCPLSLAQIRWFEDGILYVPDLLPKDLIDSYSTVRERLGLPGGWDYPTPYMQVPELRDISLYEPIMRTLNHLLGEEAGLHLNLTGWVSTQRNFHQDTYLNPPFVGTRYAAVWMALDDIHPDSGPFQFVRGSHRWQVIRQEKVFKYLTPEERLDPQWPTRTQEWVSQACFEEVLRRGQHIETYTPKKGDVLFWHSNLIHRGSEPKNPNLQRKALIAHYSTLSSRSDMPRKARHTNGRWYFVF